MAVSTVPTPEPFSLQDRKSLQRPRILDNKFYLDLSPRPLPQHLNLFYPNNHLEKQKMPTSGPFSIAAAKISNMLDGVDDVNHD